MCLIWVGGAWTLAHLSPQCCKCTCTYLSLCGLEMRVAWGISSNTEHVGLTHMYGMWIAFIHFCSLYRKLAGLFIDDLTLTRPESFWSIILRQFTGVCSDHSYLPNSGSKHKGHIASYLGKKKRMKEHFCWLLSVFMVITSTATGSGTVLRPLLMYSLLNEVSYILSSYTESISSALGPDV